MSVARTISAVAAGVGFVYVLYLGRLEVPLSASLNSVTLALASASVLSSAMVFLYLHRVGTQVQALSESRRWVGWVSFSGGIFFYILGTYSAYPDFFHWVSLWILIPSIAVLMLGVRNAALSFPLLSSLFLIAPSVTYPITDYESALLLLFSASILALVILSELLPKWVKPIVVAPFAFETLIAVLPGQALAGVLILEAIFCLALIIFLRRPQGERGLSCELDSSPINAGRKGCVNCGRLFEWRKTSHVGSEVLVLATVVIVALIFGFVSFPFVSVTASEVNLATVSPVQRSSVPLITAPPGFLENYSSPSSALQTQYVEKLVVVKQFFPVVHPENFSYTVYIEADPLQTSLVTHWQHLGGYNKTTEILTTNGSSPIEVYSTLLRARANGTFIVAISYGVHVSVMLDGSYSTMDIGVSALARPSFNVTQQEYESIKRQMLLYFVAPGARLIATGTWTEDFSKTSSTFASVEPYVPLGIGATLIIGLTSSVLSTDREDQRMLDTVDSLEYEDQRIIAAALKLRMHRAPKSGADLFSGLNSTTSLPVAREAFFDRLEHLEGLGYFTQTATLVRGQVRLLWRLTTP